MKFNLLALACALMLAFGLSMGSFAGSIADADSDGVPDIYDNCDTVANGPLLGGCDSQQDGDNDGYGNACDTDYNNNNIADITDLSASLNAQGDPSDELDLNCNGLVDITDLSATLNAQGDAPGTSGLACSAGNVKGSCPPV